MAYTTNYSESLEELDSKVKKLLNRFTPDIYQGGLNVVNRQETGNAVRENKNKKSMQQHKFPPAKINKNSLRDVCLGSC